MPTSSSAKSMVELIIRTLRGQDVITDGISPNFLNRNWSPAFKEWSIKAIRDAFFASPQFPRILSQDAVREAIAQGVTEGMFAYVGKTESDRYQPFLFKTSLLPKDVEISEDLYLIKAEEAEIYEKKITEPPKLTDLLISPQNPQLSPNLQQAFTVEGRDQYGEKIALPSIEPIWDLF